MLLFQSNCVLCDDLVKGKISLCSACRADLPRVEFACQACALPLLEKDQGEYCGQCISIKTSIDYAFNLFHYATPIDYLISKMKFQQQLSAAAILADLLQSELKEGVKSHGFPDAFIPVPLYKTRLVERGFNQSLEIIKPLARSKNIPILLDTIERNKDTQAQTKLSKKDRKKNIAGCFSLMQKPVHSHIVIVDDVVTTGATTNELAKVLKQNGVEKVGVWSLARAELS